MAIDWTAVKKKAKQQDAAYNAKATQGAQNRAVYQAIAKNNTAAAAQMKANPSTSTAKITPITMAQTAAGVANGSIPNAFQNQKESGIERAADIVSSGTSTLVGGAANAVQMATTGKYSPVGIISRGIDKINGTNYTEQNAANQKSFANKMTDNSLLYSQNAKRGLGKIGQAGVEIGSAATQIGLMALTGGVAGSLGAGSEATGALTKGLMAIQQAGQGAYDAEKAGAGEGTQALYGLLQGATVYATEGISNVGALGKVFGNGAADSKLERASANAISKFIKSDAGRAVANRIATGAEAGLGEAFEQNIQDALTPVYQRLTYEKNAKLNAEDMIYNGIVAGAVGGIVGSAGKNNIKALETENDARVAESRAAAAEAAKAPPVTNTAPNLSQVAPNLIKPSQNIAQQATQAPQANSAMTREDYDLWRISELNRLNPQLNGALKGEIVDADLLSNATSTDNQDNLIGSHYGSTVKRTKNAKSGTFTHEILHAIDMLTGGNQISKFIADIRAGRGVAHNAFENLVNYLNSARKSGLIDGRATNDEEVAQMTLHAFYKDREGLRAVSPEIVSFMEGAGLDKYSNLIKSYNEYLGTTSQQAAQAPVSDIKPHVATDTAKAVEADTEQQGKAESQIEVKNETSANPREQKLISTLSEGNKTVEPFDYNVYGDKIKNGMPEGVGATSNSFVPEQKVSKVFSNTYQKTDSLTDEQKAQMKPEDYTYDVHSHAQNETVSKQRVDVDYEGEVSDLYSKQEWTDEDVYTSAKILDKVSKTAEETGDGTELKKWTKAVQERGTRGGQTVEAFKAFQHTPEGAVIKAQQVIAEAEKKLTSKKENGKSIDTAKGRKVKAETAEVENAVKSEATNVANEIAETIKKSTKKTTSNKTDIDKAAEQLASKVDSTTKPRKPVQATQDAMRNHGVPVESWEEETGRLLSENLSKRLDAPKTPKPTPITKTILSDLVKFAEEHALPSRQVAPKLNRTAAARITDFFNNRTFYTKAWNDAQNAMREKYADNQAVLDQFDGWIGSTIGYNADGTDAVMQKAIMDAAIEGDIPLKQMRDNKALGNADSVINRIYSKLAAEVKPEGADAIILKDAVTRFVNGKTADTNTDSRLESVINGALRDIGTTLTENITKSATDKATLAKQVSDMLISKYGVEADAAAKVSETVTDKFNEMLKERAIKRLFSIFNVSENSKSKASKLTIQQVEKLVNLGSFDVDSLSELVKAKYGIPTLTSADVMKIYELNKLAQETKNDYQQRVYINRAAKIIADKMPVTGKDKFLAVRRIAMLLNPKTLISRNAGGNVVFGLLLEDIKDAPGTLVDMATTKIAKTEWRTTSYNPLATAKAEAQGFKKGITEWGMDIKNKVDTSPTEHEMPKTNAFKSTVGSAFENTLYKLLQVGDRPFYEAAKAKRIDELKRLGLDYTSEDAIAQANVYALERVFQNNSGLAKKAVQMRDSLGVIGDIAIPFAQTPANIFDKLADYSPYGFVRAIKKAGTIQDSAWSQKQFVDTLSRAMTGTGIVAFAYFANKAGLLFGGDDKEEDEGLTYQKKISGWQPYSIVVGDKSYTYDWATVVGALLSLGADLAQSENGGETLMAILSNGAKTGINTMFNQSYMEGVAELFSKSANGEQDIGGGLMSMLGSLPASFTPTAFQQIAKIIDPIARDTYDTDPFKKSWNKVKAKLPFLSQTLPAKINAAGQEITNFQGGKLSNIFESVLSPGYIGETQKTAVDTEAQRLYKSTGDKSLLPNWSEYTSKSDLKLTYKGKDYTMTATEWNKYQKTRGTLTYNLMQKAINGSSYKSMSDTEKAKVMSQIVEYTNDMAKREYIGSSYVSNDYENAYKAEKAGINPSDYFAYKTVLNGLDSNGSPSQIEKTQAIEKTSLSTAQKGKLWQLQNSDSSGEKNPYTGTLAQKGVSPSKTIEIMEAFDTIDDAIGKNYVKADKGPSAAQVKAAYLIQWLARQGYNANQRAEIADVFTTWQMIAIDKPSKKATAFVNVNPMP